MKVAITGASGFIGKNLTLYLKERNYDVIPLIRDKRKLKSFTKDTKIKPVVCDIQNYDCLLKSFANVDAVIHLAALFNNPENSWQEYSDINITGTENVLVAANNAGAKKIIHCSTIGVAIDSGYPPYSEKSPYAFPENDKYESTKYKAEKLALDFVDKENFPITIIRPAQVYGPGDLSKVKFYKMVKKGIMIRPKNTMKHLIYIEDLCRAFELTLQSQNSKGEIIIVGEETPISLDEMISISAETLCVNKPKYFLPQRPVLYAAYLIEKIFNLFNMTPPVFKRSMDFFTRSVTLDVSKAKEILGFESSVSAKVGIQRTIDWYIKNGLLLYIIYII